MPKSAKDMPAGPVQFSLALFDNRPDILKKPVQAVHMAITGGVQNKTQRLAFNAMLKNAHTWHASNPGQTKDVYEISRQKLMQMIEYTSPNRKHLKEALKQMQKMTVEWDLLRQDGDKSWGSTVLLPTVGFDEDKVFYSYAAEIKPMLLDSSTWARLDLSIQRQFRLDASAALYEWINRFRNNPSHVTNEMPWEDWRWAIHGPIEPGSIFNEYKNFKRKKLNPAIAEINDISDLIIELVEVREGRRSIKTLRFIVNEKQHFALPKEDDLNNSDWEEKLKEMKLPIKERRRILATYSGEVIDAHYRYTMARVSDSRQPKVLSIAKYFIHSIDNGYANAQAKEVKQPEITGDAMASIESQFVAERNTEAAGMFAEMATDQKEAIIAEYNALQTEKAYRIPDTPSKRVARFLVPFYAWLAKKTWDPPSAQELFEFALKHGMIEFRKK